tara:strand:+ start:201 stop:569 length:369 start_codon:yes stop_codon:yes gene_type:complete
MYKASWGQKRICPCNKIRYYDLGREKLECPECGKEIEVLNLAKPRRGRKPGALKMKIIESESLIAKPKATPEEDLDIENVDDTDIETNNAEIEDDTVLIEDESEVDPTIDVGIKNIKEKEDQ